MTRLRADLLIGCLLLMARSLAVPQAPRNLGERIDEYWSSHSCIEAKCRNPVLVVEDRRIKVVRFDGGYREDHMKAEDLSEYLAKIPLSAWPQGPGMWVNCADFHVLYPGEAEEQFLQSQQTQLLAVTQIIQRLGLKRTNKQGVPY